MPTLTDYQQFEGRHWETGSICNYYAYRGIKAPHTDQPYSEALLMGLSGGIVMGYFSFAYEGYDPHVSLLTRNTFDPMDRLLQRLGVVQHLLHTPQPARAITNLENTLQGGVPAIVWADFFSLPYNALPYDEGMWAMLPLVVYGHDEGADAVSIADRARVPLTVTTQQLSIARARIKKTKFRILTLDAPKPAKLVSAVHKGIWDCIKLYTEKPPKGSPNNFGFAAFKRWADLLSKPKLKMSWEREFPPGEKMYAGLTSAYTHITTFGKDGNAERAMYADFLDEASVILNKPALREVAQQFRISAQAWSRLGDALLPDEVPLFKETRDLMLQKHNLFLEQGNAGLVDILQMNERLAQIKSEVAANFPLDAAQVLALRESLQTHILNIHDIEAEAITALQAAMA